VRRGSAFLAVSEEWRQHAPRGTDVATGRALMEAGIGFYCSGGCGDAFYGDPPYVRSVVKPSPEQVQLYPMCKPCGDAALERARRAAR